MRKILCFLMMLLGWEVSAALNIPTSHPKDDLSDLTIWPNQRSRANGDRWLVEHHDKLVQLNPRLLVVNFSNRTPRERLDKLIQNLIVALAESSRYHGYEDENAPAFLQYRLFKFVDLREANDAMPNSSKVPYKAGVTKGFNLDYDRFFHDEFARHYGVAEPREEGRFLRLDELLDDGYVHELWIMGDHDEQLKAYECVELKPQYDEEFRPVDGKYVQAGNGGDPDQKWRGRSVRIGFLNVTRGIGCYLESLSHSLEGISTSKAIPYFTKYFSEFAGYDLKKRWGLPFNSLYSLKYGGEKIEYPDPDTAIVHANDGKEFRLTNYYVIGGNAHWPPNGRGHYDMRNTQAVMSVIAKWRTNHSAKIEDLKAPWTNEALAKYKKLAPDCMGAWLVYWRQNMPGLNNEQKDNAGKPMKNWWPFLFY